MNHLQIITPILMLLYTQCQTLKNDDMERFENGKSQYSMLQKQTKLPKFGQCWLSAISFTEKTCSELTDESQARLALQYLNCFLQIQGRTMYSCSESQDLKECTLEMVEADRSSFTTFFTHANNICFFLQSQAWHEHTDRTIHRLADTSDNVADQLEVSSALQKEMMLHQNLSINNQKMLIDQAYNLSHVLANSSVNIHDMFNEFNRTTREQRNLIMDVFDRIAKLQSLVLGEFSGFYSLIFYFLSIIISYFLTSTQRTHSARFWLFGIMTMNILLERLVFSLGQTGGDGMAGDMNEAVLYSRQWICREASCTAGLVVLVLSAYRFKDLNVINNHLLVEIRKQNSDLKKLLVSGHSPARAQTPIQDRCDFTPKPSPTVRRDRQPGNAKLSSHFPHSTPSHSLGYHSNCESETSSDTDSSGSDHTFIYSENQHADLDTSDTDSYCTVSRSCSRSRSCTPSANTPSMVEELAALRETTPFKEFVSAIWVTNTTEEKSNDVTTTMSQSCNTDKLGGYRPGLEHYNLRNRKMASTNPMIGAESARQFSKKVHHLARVASKNSMLARFTKEKENRLGDSSGDEGAP